MGSESSTVLNHLRKNRYYLDGGDIYFLAGNELFRIHRYFLERESHIFRELIKSPTVPGGPRNGESESTAIVLPNVPPAAFEKLLNVFYNPKFSVYDWPREDWMTILELSQRWGFSEVHNLAIRELDKINIPLISRIVLYQRFELDQNHLLPWYAELCKRPRALNNEESEAIGLATAVLIFKARECLWARSSDGDTSPLPNGLQDDDVHAILVTLLGGGAPPIPPTSH
ncbi:hypothetical protein C0995_004556 [Termitomyces sp. Mi166|nr:hypothetical protein C0995_004556 [Termitomyces sp. Mi166\